MMVIGREFYLAFILGLSVGVLFTVVVNEINYAQCPISIYQKYKLYSSPLVSETDFDNGPPTDDEDPTHVKLPPLNNKVEHAPIIFNDLDQLHKKGGDEIAKTLSKKVRILCWVMTQPKTLRTKGRAVKDTWGKRCNVLLFISSVTDKEFPAVGLDVPEGRKNLWLKTRAAWRYIYDNHFNDADWFMKADDDSFVVVENLRYYLARYNTTDPNYFGRHFVPFGGYNSGGAGYVFSKQTLADFVNIMKDPSKCKLKSFAEDAEVGVCLRKINTHPGDTRDELGRETFHPFSPAYHLIPGSIPKGNWLHSYNKWAVKVGPDCCSDHSIAFHYITPNQMYELEYFIYHLHPFGIHHIHD